MVGILLSSRLTSSPSPNTNTDLLIRASHGIAPARIQARISVEHAGPPIWQPVKTVLLGYILTVHGALLTLCAAVTHHFSYLPAQEYPNLHDGWHFPPLSDVDNVPRWLNRRTSLPLPVSLSFLRLTRVSIAPSSYRLYPFFEPEARFLTKFHEW